MFTDFTTAEALARHRAAELDRRIELARHRADRLADAHGAQPGRRDGGRLLGTRQPPRNHRSPAAH